MAKFITKAVLVNEYGSEVCELTPTPFGFWMIPEEEALDLVLAVGDRLTVEERESEVE